MSKYADSLYGTAAYGPESEASGPDEAYVDLMSYLPDYYRNSNTVVELQTAFGYSAGELAGGLPDLINQCFVSSATWGLELLEQVFGLTTDKTKSYAIRREILKAKMRGAGTTTISMIQNMAVAFSGGEVNILEYPEEYIFVVQFVGIKGIPQNMTGLINAIEEIKPAHLAYRFKYTYTTWGALDGMTWGNANSGQITWATLKIYEGE